MTINSVAFILFFISVAAIYLNLPQRFQNAFLLLASIVFYLFNASEYAVVLLSTIIFNYFGGKVISEAETKKKKKGYLILFIVLNLMVLAVLKYYNFFGETIEPLIELLGGSFVRVKWVAPLGISYYTLMIIGYLVDIYRGDLEWDRDFDGFFGFAVYVSFFPQIIAGPINRAKEMLPQFKERHTFNYGRTVSGMQRFLIGALKKIVIADGIAVITNAVFNTLPSGLAELSAEQLSNTVVYAESGQLLILAQLLYVLRMFGDFSGFTDMAIGVAQILGVRMMENFNAPYFAISVNDFWRRWHISLSSWLRDYIYIPLGGNRKGRLRRYFNSMVVYFVCGIWHVPSWNYAIWGICQSLMVILEDVLFLNKERKLQKEGIQPKKQNFFVRAFRHLYTMAFFSITLLFVSTRNIGDAVYFVKNMFNFVPFDGALVNNLLAISSNKIATTGLYMLLFWGGIALATIIVFYLEYKIYKSGKNGGIVEYNPLSTLSKPKRWIIYFAAGLLVMFFYMIAGTTPAPPIYQGF